ncbi:hypothetical protein FVEN_g4584 [Fusarium venenatum]|uniref:Geranylgeranyl pyrophosphate synthetase n=1 Tax=Fusarium venenatum TaxID=56646 RepID=A0A2L2T5B9_9HYPO|nr:uncharacterized protein FVRRES_02516 [Fusarium venenatum]KAG8357957.1 hypothetical protein FVEN_g4584 [Fusarium venenatum]KAH7004385.1 hypothetical protein EDB82DRAFT_486657 [Fusarium venenatum]CEI66004.1 unnamed protein product [Fusarium venenatum]
MHRRYRGNRGSLSTDDEKKPGISKTHPLGDVIERITRDSLSDTGVRAEIDNVQCVASYNWVSSSTPKIIIPGEPPRWTPLKGSNKLPQDSGDYYRDINAASYPKHPLEPAIVSVMKMHPESMPVNIVACGSSIGNLLRFTRGVDLDRCFRILVERVGDTVHLIRREDAPDQTIEDIRGFGHTFPEAYTTWGPEAKRSKTHQRIISYRFAGYDLLVRFEGDGFLGPSKPEIRIKSYDETSNANSLYQIEDIGVSDSPVNISNKLVVLEGGENIPQSSIFDLKTRSVYTRKKDHLGDQLQRLWISQIPQFLLAYHEKGLFRESDIEIKDIKSDIEKWQDQNQPCLNRLAALLHVIIDNTRRSNDGKLEIVWSKNGSLEIRKQLPDGGDVLSEPVRKQWEAWLGVEDEEKFNLEGSGRWEEFMATLSDSDEQSDYAACDAECGYCGKCN